MIGVNDLVMYTTERSIERSDVILLDLWPTLDLTTIPENTSLLQFPNKLLKQKKASLPCDFIVPVLQYCKVHSLLSSPPPDCWCKDQFLSEATLLVLKRSTDSISGLWLGRSDCGEETMPLSDSSRAWLQQSERWKEQPWADGSVVATS